MLMTNARTKGEEEEKFGDERNQHVKFVAHREITGKFPQTRCWGFSVRTLLADAPIKADDVVVYPADTHQSTGVHPLYINSRLLR